MYKYHCNFCGTFFNESDITLQIKSKLIRYTKIECPYCASRDIELTEQAKLLIERKAKIDKLNENSEGIS